MLQDGHRIGYARSSTTDQRAGLDAQVRDLKAVGCRKVFSEQATAVGQRAQLDAARWLFRGGPRDSEQDARAIYNLLISVQQQLKNYLEERCFG